MKTRTRFVCQECGAVTIKWQGKCNECNQWNTLVEEPVGVERKSSAPLLAGGALVALPDVSVEESMRTKTGVPEFDRVLGGGLVEGSLVLVGGPPGTGKSTLMLQVAEGMARQTRRPILYVTGEESAQQTRMRADRLGVTSPLILLLPEVNVDVIVEHVQKLQPALVMIDSVQTLFRPEIAAAPGSVTQVRESAATLMRLAKTQNVTVLLVGHVTKDGSIAGPRVLEHLVDTVLYFEGEGMFNFRVLKAVKNRFGPSSEVGIFEMDGAGLKGRPNASELFLAYRQANVAGSCVVPILEGTRSCLVEVQALVSETSFPVPTRRSNGMDNNRSAVLLAVLQRRSHVSTVKHDVYLNVVGGLHIEEPALDLGILLAVASGVEDIAIDAHTACVGEVGLGGELRGVDQLEKRLFECASAGFTRCLVPDRNMQPGLRLPDTLTVIAVSTIQEAINATLKSRKQPSRKGSSKPIEQEAYPWDEEMPLQPTR